MITKIRLYVDDLPRSWKCVLDSEKWLLTGKQTEVEYYEFRLDDCSLCGQGTEDFSPERYRKEIINKAVWLNGGEVKYYLTGKSDKYMNGYITFRKEEEKEVVQYLESKYGNKFYDLH